MRPRLAVAVLLVQLAVPLVALTQGVPSRFGFHMFAGRGETLSVLVLDRAGEEIPVDVEDFVAAGRPELAWADVLPERVCQRQEGAAVVTVTSRGRTRTVRCAG